ncbi:hypothetical protein L7F22_050125 [Adiantum nelumboides]|nr:hypothetical protein [Adiantum nelumboides]
MLRRSILSAGENRNIEASFPLKLPCSLSRARSFASKELNGPIPKIRVKKDRSFEHVAEQEKDITPLLRIKDTFLQFKKEAIPLQYLTVRRRFLGLRTTEEKFEEFMRNYPTLFEIYKHSDEHRPWLKLTPEAMKLVEQERLIHEREEPKIVERLRRLLMLTHRQEMRANLVMMLAPFFAFPDDLIHRVVPKYPQYFNLAQHGKPYQILELVVWDEALAMTEFEKKSKLNAEKSNLGIIEMRGYPLAFELQYSPGVVPRKVAISYLEEWQKLPFISPYENAERIEMGTPLGDRRMVAFLHELLSLTIQRKITIEVLNHFHSEFKLPENLYKAVNRYPGIFYISVKGAVHTLYLREAYKRQQLMLEEHHPMLRLKKRFAKMIHNGPRLKAMVKTASRSANYKV